MLEKAIAVGGKKSAWLPGDHFRMRGADLLQRGADFLGKTALGVSAKETECMRFAKLMPEMFKVDRGLSMTLRPKQGDQLAKCPHSQAVSVSADEQLGYKAIKEAVVGPIIDNEFRQGRSGIERNVLIARNGSCQIDPSLFESFFQRRSVS